MVCGVKANDDQIRFDYCIEHRSYVSLFTYAVSPVFVWRLVRRVILDLSAFDYVIGTAFLKSVDPARPQIERSPEGPKVSATHGG